jgi:ferredoxin
MAIVSLFPNERQAANGRFKKPRVGSNTLLRKSDVVLFLGVFLVRFVFEVLTFLQGARVQMTYVVAEPCVNCRYTDCALVCPVEAFHLDDDMLVINPETCIDCDACVPECPVEAIFAEGSVPPEWTTFTPLNAERALSGLPTISARLDPLCE